MIRVYFSDFFEVDPATLEAYGAFNVSLINDLPLFIDPFLLFNSPKPEYQREHNEIIRYLRFLRDHAKAQGIQPGLLRSWFRFPEVSQNWLGYSVLGNRGRGLGPDFADALYGGLQRIFTDFGAEEVTRSSHLEKLCLIKDGVGRDYISDFTTNLINGYLLEYTQRFAQQYISPKLRSTFMVEKVRFNYGTETWERNRFDLPSCDGSYVLLTPKDILTRDDTWINRTDLRNPHIFNEIALSIPNEQLRAELTNYFNRMLAQRDKPATRPEIERAVLGAIRQFPAFIDYYIKYKEDRGDEAVAISEEKVELAQTLFVQQISDLVETLYSQTEFYATGDDTYLETHRRLRYLKDIIEHKGGHRIFYLDGKPVGQEHDLQLLFRLVWYATPSDVSREVNDGRGPADFKVSRGAADKTLTEFKLASNTQLKRNLERQAEIYQKASDAQRVIKAILYYTEDELRKVGKILHELNMVGKPDIVLIDARWDNKPSGSKA